MTVRTIDLNETNISLNSLLDQLEADSEIRLIRGNREIARLLLAQNDEALQPRKRTLGLNEGQGRISDDFTAPLPDSFWLGEE